MTTRVFVSLDYDRVLKDFSIGQAKNHDSPFEVHDRSIKELTTAKATDKTNTWTWENLELLIGGVR